MGPGCTPLTIARHRSNAIVGLLVEYIVTGLPPKGPAPGSAVPLSHTLFTTHTLLKENP